MKNQLAVISAEIILPSEQLVTISYDPIDPMRVTMGDSNHRLYHVESGRKILESTLIAPNERFRNDDLRISSKKIMLTAAMELNDFFQTSTNEQIEPWQFDFEDDKITLTKSGEVAVSNLVSVELVTDFRVEDQRKSALAIKPVAKELDEKLPKLKIEKENVEPLNPKPMTINEQNRMYNNEAAKNINQLLLLLLQKPAGISHDELVEAIPDATHRKSLAKGINMKENHKIVGEMRDGKPILMLKKIIPISDNEDTLVVYGSQLNREYIV